MKDRIEIPNQPQSWQENLSQRIFSHYAFGKDMINDPKVNETDKGRAMENMDAVRQEIKLRGWKSPKQMMKELNKQLKKEGKVPIQPVQLTEFFPEPKED